MMKRIRETAGIIRHRLCYEIMLLKEQAFVYSTQETLELIKKKRLSAARFGDGEFNLILSQNIYFQKYEASLSEKLKRALEDGDKNRRCLVCIPSSYVSLKQFTLKSAHFWSVYWNRNKKKISPFLNYNYRYGDAQATRIYVNRRNKEDSIRYFNAWKEIWEKRDILIVEGNLSKFGFRNDLFLRAKSVNRILCPAENAYQFYDEIKQCILDNGRDRLVLLALGPTATALAYDLSKEGIWVIDSGNLDMEYEWSKRNVKEQVAIEGKYTFEAAGGERVVEIADDEFEKQIIKRIGC